MFIRNESEQKLERLLDENNGVLIASEAESPGGHIVRAYDRERTVCDVVRRKAAMDPAAYGYVLRRYAASRGKDLARLGRYAKEMGVERQVQQAMEVLL